MRYLISFWLASRVCLTYWYNSLVHSTLNWRTYLTYSLCIYFSFNISSVDLCRFLLYRAYWDNFGRRNNPFVQSKVLKFLRWMFFKIIKRFNWHFVRSVIFYLQFAWLFKRYFILILNLDCQFTWLFYTSFLVWC